MPLNNAPLSIDGAVVTSAMLRRSTFAATGGSEGVMTKGSMKVTSDGVNVSVAGGSAVVLNRYVANPVQAYVATDEGGTTLAAGDLPPVSANALSHLLCVTIGDPEFSQSGHPWMLATDPPVGLEEEFQYVRYFIVQNVPSTTTHFSQLGQNFPGLALARVDVPANTSFAAGAVVDVRELAQPRRREYLEHIAAPGGDPLNGGGGVAGAWENWPNAIYMDVFIPEWAVRAKITGFLEGVKVNKAGGGKLRIALVDPVDAANSQATRPTEVAEGGAVARTGYNLGGEISVPAGLRNGIQRFRIQGTPNTDADKSFLESIASTSGQMRILLVEEAE